MIKKKFMQPVHVHASGGAAANRSLSVNTGNLTQRIRLLKVITAFYIGGTEKQAMNLIRRMDSSLIDLRIACIHKSGHYIEELEQRGTPIKEFAIHSFFEPRFLFQQIRLIAYLRRHRIQVVHSYNFYANVFSIVAAKLAGVPVVIASIRDRGVYLSPAQKRVQKFVCKFADLLLVNAESIREWLVSENYPEEKIQVIRNGIDCSEFDVNKERLKNLRQQYGLPDTTPLVIMLTRLNPQKGIEVLLESAVTISRKFPDARLMIVGDKMEVDKKGAPYINPEYRRMRNLRDKLGLGEQVIFTGYIEDVPGLLAQADISVLPSFSEGLSNTVLESMAAGLPVVATRVGGNTELITDQVTGMLVPPRDAQALADAVCTLLQDRAQARVIGVQAREWVMKNFSFSEMAGSTQKTYVRLLEKKLGYKTRFNEVKT